MKTHAIGFPALCAAGLAFATCALGQTDRLPANILFIMSDDHTRQAISAYGSKLAHTPHIDRIAREGAIFRRSFVTNSICAPSRAVMLTGKYSHLNGKTALYRFSFAEVDGDARAHRPGGPSTRPGCGHGHGHRVAVWRPLD